MAKNVALGGEFTYHDSWNRVGKQPLGALAGHCIGAAKIAASAEPSLLSRRLGASVAVCGAISTTKSTAD